MIRTLALASTVTAVLAGPAVAQMVIDVTGKGVDIRNSGSSGTRQFFPIGDEEDRFYDFGEYHLFSGTRPTGFVSKNYATVPIPIGYHKTDSRTDYALESFTANQAGKVKLAAPTNALNAPGWSLVAGSAFNSSVSTFYLYEYTYTTPGQRVTIPKAPGSVPSLLIADTGTMRFANPRSFTALTGGTVIAPNDQYTITSPSLIVASNGDYIAGAQGGRKIDGTNAGLWISKDKGVTWSELNTSAITVTHVMHFEHQGALYVLGDNNGVGAIQKSTDGGKTWSAASNLGIDFRGTPSHVIVNNGRIWSATDQATVISAPVDSDLMNGASWTRATFNGATTNVLNEPDLMLTRAGGLVVMPRGSIASGTGRPVNVISPTEVRPNASTFKLPASASKYSIIYDAPSDKYWALTSYSTVPDDNRTGIGLFSSTNLLNFTLEQQVFEGESNLFDGFNYPFMQVDGNDIIFTLRTAFEDTRGLPERWHDANNLTFHRIANFRGVAVPEPTALGFGSIGAVAALRRRRVAVR